MLETVKCMSKLTASCLLLSLITLKCSGTVINICVSKTMCCESERLVIQHYGSLEIGVCDIVVLSVCLARSVVFQCYSTTLHYAAIYVLLF